MLLALLFPFPDLHEETLARLAAIRETERATERSAFSHKKRNLLSFRDPDPAFAALAAARLPSLLSSDSRAGPSTREIAKSARDLAAETVLARFACAFRRRARDDEDLVSRDDDAPALVQRFLASKRSLFDDLFVRAVREPGHGGDGSRPGGVAAFAAAAAARLLADARAEGARALAEDLR